MAETRLNPLKDKQIEEMALAMYSTCGECKECKWREKVRNGQLCVDYKSAELAYNAGYRKQSDVAREIFAEIDALVVRKHSAGDACDWWLYKKIDEIKKKYTEG